MNEKTKRFLLLGGLGFLLFGGFSAIGVYIMQTRSLRAKNPGSIDDIGQDYGAPEGLVKPNPDSRLLTFVDEFFGSRALVAQIYSTIFTHGHNTLTSFVHSWAPASDRNNEPEYVDFLSKRTGLKPWTIIDGQLFSVYIYSLALAVGRMETGAEIDQVWDGVKVSDGIRAGLQHVGLA